MLRVTTVLVVLCTATAIEAKEIIRCTSKRGTEVVVTLGAQRMLKRNVNCISGEFVADMTRVLQTVAMDYQGRQDQPAW